MFQCMRDIYFYISTLHLNGWISIFIRLCFRTIGTSQLFQYFTTIGFRRIATIGFRRIATIGFRRIATSAEQFTYVIDIFCFVLRTLYSNVDKSPNNQFLIFSTACSRFSFVMSSHGLINWFSWFASHYMYKYLGGAGTSSAGVFLREKCSCKRKAWDWENFPN